MKELKETISKRLIQLGILLFLFGLLTGFAVPMMSNPRMGLSSHLEGILNGIFLVVIGMIWPRLALSQGAQKAALGLILYGTFANWLVTLLAAAWGAGASMPIAAGTSKGGPMQEAVIDILLFSLSFSMVAVCAILLWGLRLGDGQKQGQ